MYMTGSIDMHAGCGGEAQDAKGRISPYLIQIELKRFKSSMWALNSLFFSIRKVSCFI